MPKVYIILVNYNGWADSIECVESLFKLNYKNVEIVLVDNASPNNSVQQIKAWAKGDLEHVPKRKELAQLSLPVRPKPLTVQYVNASGELFNNELSYDFTLIEADENKGFSNGNNLGIRYAMNKGDADYFWILNNDTVVEPDSLSSLIERYKSEENLGILGAKVKYYFQPNMIQCAGGGTYNKWLAYSKQVGNQQIDKGQFDNKNIQLDLIIGASMFVDINFIEKVGELSEDYFLYYEEQDWVERSKKLGFHLGYEPGAIVYHKEGQSIGASQLDLKGISRLSDFYYARNKIILTKKYFSLFCLLTVKLSFVLIAINRLRRGQADRIPMLIKILMNPSKHFEK